MEIIDIVEKAIKIGECGAMSIGCYQGGNVKCSRCPFSYDSKFNEERVGCASLSEKAIRKIAKHYLENINVDK